MDSNQPLLGGNSANANNNKKKLIFGGLGICFVIALIVFIIEFANPSGNPSTLPSGGPSALPSGGPSTSPSGSPSTSPSVIDASLKLINNHLCTGIDIATGNSLISSQRKDLPASYYVVNDVHIADLSSSSSLFSSFSEVLTSKASSLGISLSAGMFGGDVSMNSIRTQMDKNTHQSFYGECFRSYSYKVVSINQDALDNHLDEIFSASFVYDLNSAVSSNSFTNFFIKHGTHFQETITLGAKIEMNYYLSSDSFGSSDESKNTIAAAAHYSFDKETGVEPSVKIDNSDLEKFQTVSSFMSSHIQSTGGDPVLASEWTKWLASVESNLGVIKSDLKPYAYLVSDIDKRNSMLKAMNSYLSSCPSNSPMDICSSRGSCDFSKSSCICDPGFSGNDCSLKACPMDQSGVVCGNGGNCNSQTGVCVCQAGWRMVDNVCSQDCNDYHFTYPRYDGQNFCNCDSTDHCSGNCNYSASNYLDICYTDQSSEDGCGSDNANKWCQHWNYASMSSFTIVNQDTTSSYWKAVNWGDNHIQDVWNCGFLGVDNCYPKYYASISCKKNGC